MWLAHVIASAELKIEWKGIEELTKKGLCHLDSRELYCDKKTYAFNSSPKIISKKKSFTGIYYILAKKGVQNSNEPLKVWARISYFPKFKNILFRMRGCFLLAMVLAEQEYDSVCQEDARLRRCTLCSR